MYTQYTKRCNQPDNKDIKDGSHKNKCLVLFSIFPLKNKIKQNKNQKQHEECC